MENETMRNSLFYLVFICSIHISAQTYVSGTVYDEEKQTVPFANILFKNSSEGVISDIDGRFVIQSENNYSLITVSYVGFETSEIELQKKKTLNLDIVLKTGFELEEVLIVNRPKKRLKKKENPAFKILKGIWSHKKRNGLSLVDAYAYKKYASTEVGLNNIDQKFLKRLLKKDYDSIISIIQQDKRNKRFYIPIYLSEVIKNIYGDNRVSKTLDITEAEKEIGIQQDGFVFDRISNVFKEVNIYDNNIELLNKTFVSPVSTEGFGSYDYVLQDSIVSSSNSKTKYRIYFFPKRDGDLVFEGSFIVTDSVFAVNSISMRVNPKINLNLVRNLYFEKSFLIENDSVFLPEKNVYEADFTLLTKNEKEKGLYVKRTETFENYDFELTRPTEFYDKKIVKFKQNQFEKDSDYWQENIPNSIDNSDTESVVYNLNGNKKIKNITGLLRTLSSGYLRLSNSIEFGSVWSALAINDVEGFKVSAGFRTFKNLNDRFRLKGKLAYGFKDEQFKYLLDAKYLLNYTPRVTVGLGYLNDTDQLGSRILTSLGNTQSGFGTTSLFSRGDNYFLSRVKKISANVNIEVKKNFLLGLNYSNSHIESAAPEIFSIDYFNNSQQVVKSELVDNNAELYLLYTPNRNLFGYGVERKFGSNIYPSFLLSYQKGLDVGAGDTNYSKLLFSYNQPLKLGKFGILDTTFEAGKIFGDAQLSVLSPVPANQTFSLVANTFSLLNYYDFVVDQFIVGHFEHHFNGFILNRLPLINKLKLRSLMTFRGVAGNVSDSNLEINRSSIAYNAPTELYYEYGFGIENIGFGNLRIFRVDCIWRSEFTNPNNYAPNFGVRVGMSPGF
tara:strand:+ start:646 stop:3165 length:2520 start_codon:yes stop_codon:yes gene_type:complete